MNSNLSNNPNGKILEVGDEGFAPGAIQKFTGLGFFLVSLYLLFSKGSIGGVGITAAIGVGLFYWGIKSARAVAGRNSNYVINSQDNTFTLPYSETSYCKLTDIAAVNKRVESTRRNETYYKNGKAKQRRVTDKTYYVQLVGANIDGEFSFGNQGIRDKLYSSLKIGINDVRFLR